MAEKEAVAPLGRPAAEKETDCEVPETRVAVMVFVTEEPRVTDLSPPFAREKSNEAAVTVRVKVVVFCTPPPSPVTVMVEEPMGVEAEVLRVRAVEQVGEQEGAEAVTPRGRPVAEKVTDCEEPETKVAVMVLEPEEP